MGDRRVARDTTIQETDQVNKLAAIADDAHGLIYLFDLALNRQCRVYVCTDTVPHAERTLRAWCEARDIRIDEHTVPHHDFPRRLQATMPQGRGRITVRVASEARRSAVSEATRSSSSRE